MPSLNRSTVIGRLGRDPELKTTTGGKVVARLRVAADEVFVSNGEKKTRTEWINIECWGKTAENCGKFLKSGRLIYAEGPLRTDEYEKEGQKHYATKIVANTVTFLDRGEQGEEAVSGAEEAQA